MATPHLTPAQVDHFLARIPSFRIGVVGDLFLDRYLDIDGTLTEPSLETGLDAYQVTRVRSCPGAAGTVVNNLAALGVRNVIPVSVIGDDGEGYELRQALEMLGVSQDWLHVSKELRTPTYTKPMLGAAGKPARELNRLDIKNRSPMPRAAAEAVLAHLRDVWPRLDALIVSDQVSEPECGVVTSRVREQLAVMGAERPATVILADSRARIGQFRAVWLKPNQKECREAIGDSDVAVCARELAARAGRPLFCTRGADGIQIIDPRRHPRHESVVPAVAVTGPIDPVGAGDSVNAGLACGLAAGASLEEAAAFANLVASITIRQLGTTGTATPEQLREACR